MTDTEELDERWMALALSLGSRGLGKTWPNPSVGCVIIASGRVVGRGRTGDGGRPHAEVVALNQAGNQSINSTVYVTLEPCAHFGETGPCVQALIDAQVSRVVISIKDPDVRTSGKGVEALKRAGIIVKIGVLRGKGLSLNLGFIMRIRLNRPLVTLKLGTSFDGKIATHSRESKWITGPTARRRVHCMRSQYDAILVGGGTARNDSPLLTVREIGVKKNPVRIIVSSTLNIPHESSLSKSINQGPIWLVHGSDVDQKDSSFWILKKAKLLEVGLSSNKFLDLGVMLKQLADLGITRIFCEGGSQLAGSLLEENLVDRVVGFLGGRIIGSDGVSSIGKLNFNSLESMPKLKLTSLEDIEGDILHSWDTVLNVSVTHDL
ncbi:MAG: bifunctional diaminohydroxyphosphoribosylaminopyrimidine deaminase/5-amino-6-(5-phosphoribosylamino)uracil reductase RibD [Proteobacteria bacterium]|nr:bifunctional diaminohydroxyphosphoribosylaminopyrimidine deaminase/5-amino-6-(5-phosphoribosylamino)uracil reductase RibD [Pseudomonadota bacterium]MDA1238217.1 bifunctional diaminohydroxyphosphoribosylaminopyrimidine deaminase/5-amino-6-(5-phosphoribosylamino)uracil reductase RibD [Pseudomonadota bacterium]